MAAPKCPHCSLELHSYRQRECKGCGRPVDPKALEAIAEMMDPRSFRPGFGGPRNDETPHYINEYPEWMREPFDIEDETIQWHAEIPRPPPREVECEIVAQKALPAPETP